MEGRSQYGGVLTGVFAGVLVGVSCGPSQFFCSADAQCTDAQTIGRCEPSGFCSFPDEDCESGWAFGAHANENIAGQCVGEPGGTSTDAPATSDSGTGPSMTTIDPDGGTSGTTTSTPTPTPTSTSSDDSTTGPMADPWFDCTFPTRYRLELSGVESGTELSDFEMLVALTADRVDLDELGPSGSNLCFVTPEGSVLPWEPDTFSEGDSLLAWVSVPSLYSGGYLYAYLGGDPAGCDAASIWADNDYVGVYHLGEPVEDQSPADNEPIEVTADPIAGPIGGAREYDSDTDVIQMPPADSLAGIFGGGGTITAWVRPMATTGERRIVERADSGQGANGWLFLINDTVLELRRGGSLENGRWASDVELEVGTWYHVAVVFNDDDPDQGASFWVDGVATDSTEVQPLLGDPEVDPTQTTELGRAPVELGNLEGGLDEVRLSTVARLGDWIAHRVLSDTDALIEYGPAESSPCAE